MLRWGAAGDLMRETPKFFPWHPGLGQAGGAGPRLETPGDPWGYLGHLAIVGGGTRTELGDSWGTLRALVGPGLRLGTSGCLSGTSPGLGNTWGHLSIPGGAG